MNEIDEALRRLVAQVGEGTDVWLEGTPAAAGQLLAAAEGELAGLGTVVRVAAPVGELNLSGLIAQLSGRADLDGQDDGVLELGIRRLTGEGRTVLVLLAPHGIGRSALRCLQHLSHQAPRMVAVVLGSAPLMAALAEPGFQALRTRWRAADPLVLTQPAASQPAAVQPMPLPSVPLRSTTARPVVAPMPVAIRAVAKAQPLVPPTSARRNWRRPVLWAASALGAAAIGGLLWLTGVAPRWLDAAAGQAKGQEFGQISNETLGRVTRRVAFGAPVEVALVPPPPLAAAVPLPLAAAAAMPTVPLAMLPVPLASRARVPVAATPVVAVAPPPAAAAAATPVATAAATPVTTAVAIPVTAAATPVAIVATPPAALSAHAALPPLRRVEPARREPTRLARARAPAPVFRGDPRDYPGRTYSSRYDEDRFDDIPPLWVRREIRRQEGPYLGTYAVDPYGVRSFRYDP